MAYYQAVNVQAITDYDQVLTIMQKIERDPASYTNPAAARKGAPCQFKVGAAKKLAALDKRYDKLTSDCGV